MSNFSYSVNGRIFCRLPKLTRAELNKQMTTNSTKVESENNQNQEGIMQEYNSGTMISINSSTGKIDSQKKQMITDKNITTLEDLKKVMPEAWLTESFLNQYFDFIPKKQTTDRDEFSVDLYKLKSDLYISGKEIKTIGELIDALTSQIPNNTIKMTRTALQNYLNKYE